MPELSILALLKLTVGLGLLNVWLLRAGWTTGYRGGDAQTLREEFEVYGLPDFMFYLVGGLKVVAGVVLVMSLWMDQIPAQLAAGIVAALMLGALAMHVKVSDPMKRSIPGALVLSMCAAILVLA